MFRSIPLFAFLLLMAISVYPQSPDIEQGVSKELAQWRAKHYSDVRYKIDLSLVKMSPVLKGTIEVRVRVAGKRDIGDAETRGRGDVSNLPIILDWRGIAGHEDKSRVFDVLLNGNSVKPEELNQHLIFREGVKDGENVVKLSFESPILKSGSAITRYVDSEDGSEYIYSLFVPSDASTAFPVFDQPDLKARFKLSVSTINFGGHVISNTPGSSIASVNSSANGIQFLRFQETKPISTYVFAFAAGNFKKLNESDYTDQATEFSGTTRRLRPGTGDGKLPLRLVKEEIRGISLYVRNSQAKKLTDLQRTAGTGEDSSAPVEEVFRLNREAITYFEKYFDYKFPFPKYDIVLIPEFPFGGMEHAGATFLRERSVIFPTEPTSNDYIARASVIFHEAAHQWFGDTVTMEWFDDLWLKEGFATFMAYKAMSEVLPEYDAWKVFYERTKPGAYATDVTKGTVPIYQDIPNLNSAKSAYGNIVYQKAPSFLKQAEFYLGEKDFQNAVQLFLRHHAYGNADWSSLVMAFEATSKKDLSKWADAWVKTRGVPVVRLKKSSFHSYPEMGKPHDTADIYTLLQDDAVGEGGKWPLKTKVLLRFESGEQNIKEVDLLSQSNKTGFAKYWVDIQSNPNFKSQAPVFVFPNFDDKAYGIFLLDPLSQRYALENIQNETDPFLRSMMWGALWDSVRFGELDPAKYIELAIKNIDVEKDDTTIASILGRVGTAFTYYLSDEKKNAIGLDLESMLLNRMANSSSNGQLLTYYRTYLNTAQSTKSIQFLKTTASSSPVTADATIHSRLVPLLRAKDRFDIVTRLIELGGKDASSMLAKLEKENTDDASKRDAYAAKAAIAAVENKKKYFDDFVNNKELSESWIEAAFNVWNSPSHSELTLPYLERALAELPNLKRDRKIFFVNGWLGAFIGGQKSQEALDIVNKFLKDNPGLDADLRRKILERVDGLERAVRIRKKYDKKSG